MIVEAKCLMRAWDSLNARQYDPGLVPDYDTDNEALNSLTTHMGEFVFQFPGHEGRPQTGKKKTISPVVEAETAKKPMSAERKQKLRDSLAKARAAKRAAQELVAA